MTWPCAKHLEHTVRGRSDPHHECQRNLAPKGVAVYGSRPRDSQSATIDQGNPQLFTCQGFSALTRPHPPNQPLPHRQGLFHLRRGLERRPALAAILPRLGVTTTNVPHLWPFGYSPNGSAGKSSNVSNTSRSFSKRRRPEVAIAWAICPAYWRFYAPNTDVCVRNENLTGRNPLTA